MGQLFIIFNQVFLSQIRLDYTFINQQFRIYNTINQTMAKIQLNQDHTNNITQIIPTSSNFKGGLYLGNQVAATNINLLKKYQITCIITIAAQLNNKYTSNIVHKHINLADEPLENIYQYFQECYVFIKKNLQYGNVFVHCKMGISRSASMVIAYLMRKYKCGYQKAYTKVKDRRKIVQPNSGFVMQLKMFQKKIKEMVAKSKE